jgi:hypothetical protein
MKGEMIRNKEAFMTSQKMLERPLASGPQNKSSLTFLSYLMEID